MGAPTSATQAEIFFQFLEHKIIYKILNQHQNIDYYQYVDDILMIYSQQHMIIEITLDDFNSIHPKIKFTIEKEIQNRINYLNLTITIENNKLTFAIYRKPATTDSIIHNELIVSS
jgi:hypothetical protein